ncbi:MAG: zf-HC2 domain-containing protein [Methylovulum sp.]|uniref:zf-HC2 domain-containing protein n=1 Tax=Methylovulum sp. TaxID=1916980 RepID=UPI002637323F|nr:zf-HC2 domain-containing protein [Methylovulum sp.]MDD2724885.1 zf-HC2 domain-containing protein [Methylovulum sp.]MDD5124713.1 zf-HC2 domain-containing protein [Methylovulum sp.]
MNRKADDGHGIVAELLPWYVNGTLGSKEQEWVAGHLADCPKCRVELEQYQQLSSVISNNTETPDWQPSPAHFGQILSALDAEENGVIRNVAVVKKPSFLGQCADWLQAQAKPLVWALALETIVLAALVLFVVLPRLDQQTSGQTVFQTLSDAHAPTVAGLPRVHIVFADDIMIGDLRLLLVSVNARLVDGPSKLGVYTVELATVGNPDATALAIATLRKHSKVKLAEPVHP